jgi:hypothetical protein
MLETVKEKNDVLVELKNNFQEKQTEIDKTSTNKKRLEQLELLQNNKKYNKQIDELEDELEELKNFKQEHEIDKIL